MLVIRDQNPGDIPAILSLLEAAFQSCAESQAVGQLLQNRVQQVSLVAVSGDQIAGYILFSPVELEPIVGRFKLTGLAPLAVLPAFQNAGIGSQLVAAGLQRCRALEQDAVFVLGDPGYYQRFGFKRASSYGIANTYGVDEPFMLIDLVPGCLDGISGTAHYRPEFDAAGV